MVSIDTVYQKVLAFANKEQRGYITPQEFNLFAEHAQLEIFEQYFYDLNQQARVSGRSEEYSDIVHNLNEKLAPFETTSEIDALGEIAATDLYRLGTVRAGGLEIEQVQQNEILYINQSPLTAPTNSRRVYVREGHTKINIFPLTEATCTYLRKPTKPNWGYYVVGHKALFDSTSLSTSNFELHPSEETELIYKILKFSGVAIKREDISKGGQGLESIQVQQEKQ